MGQDHYLVNLEKKQVIHPNQIGNGTKLQEQIGWRYSTATVLVMLLAASSKGGGRGGGDFQAAHPLTGSWAGDRIAFVGDYAMEKDIPGFDAPLLYQQCQAACHPEWPGPKPEGWQAWTNISAQVRQMMTAEFGIQYAGEGWLDIVEAQGGTVRPILRPDVVLTNQAKARPLEPSSAPAARSNPSSHASIPGKRPDQN
jgi:hypothetical protein